MGGHTHTPGPWATFGKGGKFVRQFEKGLHGLIVADCSMTDEGAANARLISAAPDLFDCLDEVLNYRGGADNALEDEYVMERAFAAIAAAKGTTPARNGETV